MGRIKKRRNVENLYGGVRCAKRQVWSCSGKILGQPLWWGRDAHAHNARARYVQCHFAQAVKRVAAAVAVDFAPGAVLRWSNLPKSWGIWGTEGGRSRSDPWPIVPASNTQAISKHKITPKYRGIIIKKERITSHPLAHSLSPILPSSVSVSVSVCLSLYLSLN